MPLTTQEMLEEIHYYEPNYNNENTDSITEKFNEIVQKNKKTITIQELFSLHEKDCILIDTPDGFQTIGDFWLKKPRTIYHITTKREWHKGVLVGGCSIKCSNDHLIEYHPRSPGTAWIKAEDLKYMDTIFCNHPIWRWQRVDLIKKLKKEPVFDFEVEHPNHRYWAGNGGVSSHNSGKTYLCLNVVKNAIEKGYEIIWFDTESAIDIDTMKRFGIDTDKVNYQPIDTVTQAATILSNIVTSLKDQRNNGFEIPKLLVVLDSLGNLSTRKEMEDANTGSEKKDMTRPGEIKRLFRIIINRCGVLKIPVVITNHTYKEVGAFIARDIVSGGGGSEYNPSINLMLSKAQLKESETKTGIIVTSKVHKSRFTKEISIKFHISFYKGMNPYVGLQKYVDWDSCGIGPGKIENGVYIEEKNTDTDKVKSWAIKHLNKHIKPKELFTPEVFTDEVLQKLDEKIKTIFEFPDIMQAQMQEVEELVKISEKFDEETGEIFEDVEI